MILMYHKVAANSPTLWWVTANQFYRQMCELQAYQVVTLDQYDPQNPDHCVITFDGVYQNVLEFAAPILKQFNYPFELFLTSDYIGKTNDFDTVEPEATFASAEELRALVKSGGRLQWHTRSHRKLDQSCSPEEAILELSIPAEVKNLDPSGFNWFAYPHGDFKNDYIKLVKERYDGAVSCIQGDEVDRYKLNRITVENDTSFRKATVGVAIPSYNYGRFLIEAVESVLAQTRRPDEILIMDDCSQDNTKELGELFQARHPGLVRYVRNAKNLGIIENFNKAVSLMSSEYICFLGADNRFRSDYLEKTCAVLDRDKNCGIVYSDFALFGARALHEYQRFPEEFRGRSITDRMYVINFPNFTPEVKANLNTRNVIHGSSLYRRAAFEQIGGYKEDKEGVRPEDHNLFFRMIGKGWSAKRVAEPLLEYRQHSVDQANQQQQAAIQLRFLQENYKQNLDTLNAQIAELRESEARLSDECQRLTQIIKERNNPIVSQIKSKLISVIDQCSPRLGKGLRKALGHKS